MASLKLSDSEDNFHKNTPADATESENEYDPQNSEIKITESKCTLFSRNENPSNELNGEIEDKEMKIKDEKIENPSPEMNAEIGDKVIKIKDFGGGDALASIQEETLETKGK